VFISFVGPNFFSSSSGQLLCNACFRLHRENNRRLNGPSGPARHGPFQHGHINGLCWATRRAAPSVQARHEGRIIMPGWAVEPNGPCRPASGGRSREASGDGSRSHGGRLERRPGERGGRAGGRISGRRSGEAVRKAGAAAGGAGRPRGRPDQWPAERRSRAEGRSGGRGSGEAAREAGSAHG
jgi:hypothetical protein